MDFILHFAARAQRFPKTLLEAFAIHVCVVVRTASSLWLGICYFQRDTLLNDIATDFAPLLQPVT